MSPAPESAQPSTVQSYADRICSNWQKATVSIFDVARVCAEARKRLTSGEKKKLYPKLPFSIPIFSKLADIGDCSRFQDEQIVKLLPPNYSIMYEVAKLSREDFQAAVDEQILSPGLKRADLQDWVLKRQGSAGMRRYNVALPAVFFAAIRLRNDLSAEESDRLNARLDQIASEFDVEIVRPTDPDEKYAQRIDRWSGKIMDHIRKAARRVVRAAKSAKKDNWHFYEDEVDIPPDADEERIRLVLDTIGRGDVFDSLRENALAIIEQPDPPPQQSQTREEQQAELAEAAKAISRRRRKKPNLGPFENHSEP
jgi:hypothetical protein